MYFLPPEILMSVLGKTLYFTVNGFLFDAKKGVLMNKTTAFYAYVVLVSFFCLVIASFGKKQPTLTRKEKRKIRDQVEFLKEKVKKNKKLLYEEYLNQAISTSEL